MTVPQACLLVMPLTMAATLHLLFTIKLTASLARVHPVVFFATT